MAKLNKECILCKTKYSFCNRCAEYDHLPRWMGIYCSDNCRTVFMTLTDYSFKHLSKEDAKKVLDTCDLSKKDVYHESTKRILDEVYAEEPKEVTAEEVMPKPVEPVVESDAEAVSTAKNENYAKIQSKKNVIK